MSRATQFAVVVAVLASPTLTREDKITLDDDVLYAAAYLKLKQQSDDLRTL